MKRYVIINSQNVVVNTTLWDEISAWQPPSGFQAIQNDFAEKGDMYNPETQDFIKPILETSEEII